MSAAYEAIELLKKDYIRNYCILELSGQSGKHEIFISGNSVLVRLLDNDNCFTIVSSSCRDEGLNLAEKLNEKDRYIFHVGEFPGDVLIRGMKIKQFSDCVQMYLPDNVKVEADTAGVVRLEPDMASFIHDHYDYRHVVSKEYIEERIKVGPAFGILENGKPVGWVMTHDEGTMGVLQVLPEYRGRGLATKLNCALIRSLRELGRPCISHIVKGNTASLALSEKTGFKYSCDVQWIILE